MMTREEAEKELIAMLQEAEGGPSYAHTHNTVEETFFQKCVKELNENKKLSVQQGKPIRAINVGCMMPYMKYEPRTLKEILSAQDARKE